METFEFIELVKAFKDNKISQNNLRRLIDYIGDYPIRKYLKQNNRLLDNEDIKQEYYIGIIKGMEKVDLSTPVSVLSYIRKVGWSTALYYIRKTYQKYLHKQCNICGKYIRINAKKCKHCGNIDVSECVISEKQYVNSEIVDMLPTYMSLHSEIINNKLDFDLKYNLILNILPSDSMKKLFLLLSDPVILDSDNYIKELSVVMGYSNTTIITQKLKKIKKYISQVEDLLS